MPTQIDTAGGSPSTYKTTRTESGLPALRARVVAFTGPCPVGAFAAGTVSPATVPAPTIPRHAESTIRRLTRLHI